MSDSDTLLHEQQRTTHAVRAIAKFMLILFPTQFLGAGLILWGNALQASSSYYGSSEETTGGLLVMIGGMLVLVGLLVAVIQGAVELGQSKRR